MTAQVGVAVVPSAIGLLGAVLVLAAAPSLDISSGRVVQAVGLGCVGVSLLVLFSTLVGALRTLRGR